MAYSASISRTATEARNAGQVWSLESGFFREKGRDAMKKPAWAKRMDAVNFAIIGVIMVFIVWETVSRLVH